MERSSEPRAASWRPATVNHSMGMTAAMRNGVSCRMQTESQPSCGSPAGSGDPKEGHNYSSAKSSNARSTSPASDPISFSPSASSSFSFSSSSFSLADDHDHYEFATKGNQEGSERSEGGVRSHESHSDMEGDDGKPGGRSRMLLGTAGAHPSTSSRPGRSRETH